MNKYFLLLLTVITFVSCKDGNDWDERVPVTIDYYNGETPKENVHLAIDLGLPSGTLWANCDLGATSPSGKGLYFAWADTEGHDEKYDFSIDNYKYFTRIDNSHFHITKYRLVKCCYLDRARLDGITVMQLSDDAAFKSWGSEWMIPSYDQCAELLNHCKIVPITRNGVSGYELVGPNGNSIFMSEGFRWTNNLQAKPEYEEQDYDCLAYCLGLRNNKAFIISHYRNGGSFIRPVRR